MKNYSITLPSYSIGDNVYSKIGEICEPYGKKVICIGGKTAISKVRDLIMNVTAQALKYSIFYGTAVTLHTKM